MKRTTTDGGVGSGDDRDQSDVRGCRSFFYTSWGEARLRYPASGQGPSGLRGGVARRCSAGWLARPESMAKCPSKTVWQWDGATDVDAGSRGRRGRWRSSVGVFGGSKGLVSGPATDDSLRRWKGAAATPGAAWDP